MATLLLMVIYLAFISLGVPDSLLGTAWPVVYREFGVPLSFASVVGIVCSFATMTSSMNSARIISRLGTGKVAAFSTLLTALALLGYSFTGSFWMMLVLAIPLGLGAGCIDSALNNYVSLHYNATVMSFLHCFYGIGVMVSPYIMSLVISGAQGWRGGYRMASLIQCVIGVILLLALPLWKKAHGEESIQAEKQMKVLPIRETMRIPGALMTCLLFLTFCVIEVICGGWSATYMVEAKGAAADLAARATMFFYLGMALGRFLSGVLAKKLTPWQIILVSMGVLGVALLMLLLAGNTVLTIAALLLAGLGVGPLYPNFNYMTPLNFGKDVSQSVMGMQMTFASIGTITAPLVCGLLGQVLGMGIFPYFLLVFYVLTVVGIVLLRRTLRAQGKMG